jgi:hypothetical protein
MVVEILRKPALLEALFNRITAARIRACVSSRAIQEFPEKNKCDNETKDKNVLHPLG